MSDNGASSNGSRLEWLRARHEALKADRSIDKPVPGYEGRLVVRYGPVPWDVAAKLQPLATGNPNAEDFNTANTDVLIAACRDVLVREDDGTLQPISGDGPARFGPDLAALLGAEATTARAMVEWVFPTRWAIAEHAGELIAWTRDGQQEDSETLVGE